LLTAEEVNRMPLGWGAYMVEEWLEGESIRLVKNPYYFRADEGLPYFDILNFKFISPASIENISQLANGQCDVISDSVLDITFLDSTSVDPVNYGFKTVMRESGRLEMLAFGIKPSSYDDYYYPYGVDRPDVFGDIRTRQAFAYCIDRENITKKLMKGLVDVSDTYLPSNNPYLNGLTPAEYPYDPATGAALLESVGWIDLDFNPETPRAHIGSALIPYGTPLSVSLLISEAGLRNGIAAEISANLANCGIEIVINQIPANEIYLPGPEGQIFGRKFDLALLSWETGEEILCAGFTSLEIPSDNNDWLGEITGGANYYGYANSSYDLECKTYSAAGLDQTGRTASGQAMLRLLADELPFLPLFHYPDAFMINDQICPPNGLDSEYSLFVDIESINDRGTCE
ncbi:MAG TPA: ABC transporter substrate-binding protein, partial [Pelolinea sp.]|nr:ABC transporter substrate-binding protein [Pelolinea sp.]